MAEASSTLSQAVRTAYQKGQEDEMLEPHFLVDKEGNPIGRIRRGDGVIFYNIRGEREIELTQSLSQKGFDVFPVEGDLDLHFATMIQYRQDLPVKVAFPPEGKIEDTLSDTLSRHGLRQVKITEAEKAVHVGFFLNGKKENPLPGEERIIIPTRKDVALFDEAPEMSIDGVTDAVINKIHDPACHFLLANFPNVDVVGHIENEAAILRAVEAVDHAAGRVIREAIRAGITVMVTADHGTVESWLYPDGAVDTGHTDSPVPFILIHPEPNITLRPGGELTDIAPTILHLLGLPRPEVMTGRTLIEPPECYPCEGRPRPRRVLMLILDGWGYNDNGVGNLIAKARTPTMDHLIRVYPHTTLRASGDAVGLPPGTVGNSEAGHLHIGAGRRIYSDRVRIDQAIDDGSFFENEAFQYAMPSAGKSSRALHLMGIVSFFSSHGSIHHLFALMDLAKRKGLHNVYIHAMLGRRGEQPESGAKYIEKIERKSQEIGLGRVVSVIGRYWSMDREENWDRIEKTYRMLVNGAGIPILERS